MNMLYLNGKIGEARNIMAEAAMVIRIHGNKARCRLGPTSGLKEVGACIRHCFTHQLIPGYLVILEKTCGKWLVRQDVNVKVTHEMGFIK